MSVQPKEFVYSNFETLALFVERINKGDEYLVSAREGVALMRTLDAVYESSAIQQEVRLA